MCSYHEKKPNVLYHGIWALLAFLLNNSLCSLQETVVGNLAIGNSSFLKVIIWFSRILFLSQLQFTISRLGFFPGSRRGSRGGSRGRSGGYHVLHEGCQLSLILSGLGMADVVTIP